MVDLDLRVDPDNTTRRPKSLLSFSPLSFTLMPKRLNAHTCFC